MVAVRTSMPSIAAYDFILISYLCRWTAIEDYSGTWGQRPNQKKKVDDLSWTLNVYKSLRVMLCAHSSASTRNLEVAPLML